MFRKSQKNGVVVFGLMLSIVLAQMSLEHALAGSLTNPKRHEVEKDALGFVELILKNTATLKSPANRIKLRSLGVSLIAKSNRDLAQMTCREIASDLSALYITVSERGEERTTAAVDALRADAIRTISDADASLALALLRDTVTGFDYQSGLVSGGGELEAYIADKLLDKDPQRAYELLRNSQRGNYATILPDFLQRLGRRDMKMAREAAGATVDNLMREDLARRHDAFFAAVSLITLNHASQSEPSTRSKDAGSFLTKESEVALLGRMFAAANTPQGRANGLQPQLIGLLRIADDVLPESAVTLRQQLEDLRKETSRQAVEENDFWYRARERSLDDAVTLIADEPKGARALLYRQAAERAIASGDIALAREIIGTLNVSSKDRWEIGKEIAKEDVLRAADVGNVSLVQTRVGLAPPGERANLLIEAVNKLPAGHAAKESLSLLDEAHNLLREPARTFEQFNVRLRLAQAYMRFDATRAGEILAGIVTQLNDVLSSAAALDGFLSDGPILYDGELDFSTTGSIVTMYLASVHQVGLLAQYDYGKAVQIANQFQRPETQMMAGMIVAESVLARAANNP